MHKQVTDSAENRTLRIAFHACGKNKGRVITESYIIIDYNTVYRTLYEFISGVVPS